MLKQRQPVPCPARLVEGADLPKGGTAVEADGAKGIGIGELFHACPRDKPVLSHSWRTE